MGGIHKSGEIYTKKPSLSRTTILGDKKVKKLTVSFFWKFFQNDTITVSNEKMRNFQNPFQKKRFLDNESLSIFEKLFDGFVKNLMFFKGGIPSRI